MCTPIVIWLTFFPSVFICLLLTTVCDIHRLIFSHLDSSELERAERAVEAQHELCDHLSLQMHQTKLELTRQTQLYVISIYTHATLNYSPHFFVFRYEHNLTVLTHESVLETAQNVTGNIHLKRKFVLPSLALNIVESPFKMFSVMFSVNIPVKQAPTM